MTQPTPALSDLHDLHPNELRQRFVVLDDKIERLLAKAEKSGLTDGERRQLDELDAESGQVAELIQTKERNKPKTGPIKPMATTQVGNEEHTYRPDGRESYFRDLVLTQFRGDFDARDRLHRHKEEIETSQPEFRDLNRTDTTGGEFVPPIWLIDDYAAALRAGRTTANLLTQRELPGGTDSINIPKISTGGSVDPQTADNASVSETDPVSTTLSGPVRTLAGQVDLSLQLLEQSPASAGMDSIIYADLLAAYNAKLNTQVLNGTGGSGQITGILQTSGIIDVDYTDASPTVIELFTSLSLLKAKSQSERQRFANLEAIVMHPRRWNWILSGLDSSNRPYVLPAGYGPQNAQGVVVAANAEGLVGNLAGLPVYSDPGIPTTLGGGTEDVILLGRFSDAMLFESTVRTRLLLEPLSGTLTARAQLYRYVAFIVRYPLGFATVSDTGLTASGVSGF